MTQHTYAGAWRKHLADTTIKQDEIPARIQNILDSQKDKFTKIEHYYPWVHTVGRKEWLSSIFCFLFFGGISGICIMASVDAFFDKFIFTSVAAILLSLPVLFLTCVFGFVLVDDFLINPGCFCLIPTTNPRILTCNHHLVAME